MRGWESGRGVINRVTVKSFIRLMLLFSGENPGSYCSLIVHRWYQAVIMTGFVEGLVSRVDVAWPGRLKTIYMMER